MWGGDALLLPEALLEIETLGAATAVKGLGRDRTDGEELRGRGLEAV
jgi:hypothetical protein